MNKDRGEFPRYVMVEGEKAYTVAYVGGEVAWLMIDASKVARYQGGERAYNFYHHQKESEVTEIPVSKIVPFEQEDYDDIMKVLGKETKKRYTILATTSDVAYIYGTDLTRVMRKSYSDMTRLHTQLDGSPLTKEI